MSNLMSAPRKALLEYLRAAADADIAFVPPHLIEQIAGISPRSVIGFRNALIEEGLIVTEVQGIHITDKGREALRGAVVPPVIEVRKTGDRSVQLAEIIADPLTVRANVRDLHRYLIEGQAPKAAARNMNHVEELLSLLNGVARMHAGAR